MEMTALECLGLQTNVLLNRGVCLWKRSSGRPGLDDLLIFITTWRMAERVSSQRGRMQHVWRDFQCSKPSPRKSTAHVNTNEKEAKQGPRSSIMETHTKGATCKKKGSYCLWILGMIKEEFSQEQLIAKSWENLAEHAAKLYLGLHETHMCVLLLFIWKGSPWKH